MWFIYISLCIGIFIGAWNVKSTKLRKYNDIATIFCIFSLLFIMGIKIGLSKDVISQIDHLGLSGFLYAAISVLFSIIVVTLLTSFSLKVKRK